MAKETSKQVNEEKDPLLSVTGETEVESAEPETSAPEESASAEQSAPVSPAETPAESTADTEGKKKDLVPYVLPLNVLSSDEVQVVLLNGKPYTVRAGEQAMMPRGVVGILENAVRHKLAAQKRARALRDKQ